LPTGFYGQACLSTKITLDAEYGIYPAVTVPSESE
jgi:hypothetical protein